MRIPHRPILSLALMLAAGQVHAQAPAPPPARPEVQQSEARVKEGIELASKSRWNDARVAFLQAYAIRPAPVVLWNIAIAECESGMPVDCLRHLRQYARSPRTDPENMATLPRLVNEANEKTGHLQVNAQEVYVDGKIVPDRGSADEVVDVSPGQHEVRLTHGALRETYTMSLAPGESKTLELKGDGANPLASGSSEIGASSRAEPAPITSSRPARGRTAFLIAGAALTAGGVVVTTVYGLQHRSASRDIESLSGSASHCKTPSGGCAALAEAVDDRKTAADVFNVALPLTLGVGAATVLGYLLWPESKTIVALGLGRSGEEAQIAVRGIF